ncbi:hypothetical protein PRK78_007272 [Emydomyces testavorans]|uniref:Uncharacterized protein n=1 Tax=Emydomyces testavorans TaxID=2070801 RepID=A0AAF0DR51_9EURO|nr:hypothetical protein PRK78_007272 [Emydomyces testavorans]
MSILDSLKDLPPLLGRLAPLPTVQEVCPSHEHDDAYVAEIDIKSANKVVKSEAPFCYFCSMVLSLGDCRLLDSKFPRDPSLNRTYLRRFAKPEHLPDHLRRVQEEDCSSIHILISPPLPDRSELEALLAPYAPTAISTPTISSSDNIEVASSAVRIQSTKIPLQPPVSPEQAQEWSRKYWPTTYNPAAQPASHSPPPTILARTHASIAPHAGFYLSLARKLALEAAQSHRGRPIGAVVVDPELLQSNNNDPSTAIIAVASDARYHDAPHVPIPTQSTNPTPSYNPDSEGQPSHHALLRVISLISQKRLTASSTTTTTSHPQPLPTPPLSPLESHFFHLANLPPPSRGGYLCTSLDIYITHEPCLCCAMGMLLSRFRTIIVGKRVKGGSVSAALDAERGYGLHWRRELNWRAMGFEFVEEGKEEGVSDDSSAQDGFGFHV